MTTTTPAPTPTTTPTTTTTQTPTPTPTPTATHTKPKPVMGVRGSPSNPTIDTTGLALIWSMNLPCLIRESHAPYLICSLWRQHLTCQTSSGVHHDGEHGHRVRLDE